MPRPRRAKVASNDARVVVTSSEEAPTSNASKPSKADSMAPLKRTRGGAARFKKNEELEEIESSGQAAKKKPARKVTRKKSVKKAKKSLQDNMIDDNEDDEVEEAQTSAMDMLKKRIGVPFAEPSARISSVSSRTLLNSGTRDRQQTSPARSPQPMPRVASTPQVIRLPPSRGRTPTVQLNTDDDLYGLSPTGKVSQARFAPRRSSVPRAPMSALRVQGTPGMETSVLALQNFKRRPRQPSLIRMVQQSSELGREDEEALLGPDSEIDDTLRDFDNFLPQDESTPLNFGKKKQSDEAAEKSHSAELEEPRTTSSRKRKRTEAEEEEEIQVPGSSPYGSSPPRIAGTTWARSSRSSSLPEERVVASAQEQDPIYAETLSQSDIHAPPRSSSAPASPKRQRTRGGKETPSEAKVSKAKATRKAPKVSTAHLQSLLPKLQTRSKSNARNAKRNAAYDVPSDSEEEDSFDLPEDNDEISRPANRRRAKSARPAKTPLAKKDTNRKSTKKTSPAKVKHKRTYGRQQSIDKENDESAFARSLIEDEDDTIEVLVPGKAKSSKSNFGKSKELERARKKFAAVDEWEMEFESVDLGGESSPWR